MNRYKYERKEYTSEQLAYLAGIIDGEGSIYIGNFSSNPKTGTKYYQTNIEITNCDKNLMDWLINTFGARIYEYTKKQMPKNSTRETYYRWIATGERVTHLIDVLMPYFIVKKQQAEIMKKMRATFKPIYGVKRGQQGIDINPPELISERQMYFEQMQSLHIRNYKNKKT
jgi:hypothetical protein